MHGYRTTALVVALQGLLALPKLQHPNANTPFVLAVVAGYLVLAAWLWARVRWAALAGIVVTLPQTVLLSTWTFTWACFVGFTFGFDLALPPDEFIPRPAFFGLHGVQFMAAHGGFMPGMPGTLGFRSPAPCFGVNVVAVYVLVLLILCWRSQRQATKVAT